MAPVCPKVCQRTAAGARFIVGDPRSVCVLGHEVCAAAGATVHGMALVEFTHPRPAVTDRAAVLDDGGVRLRGAAF